MVGGVDSMLYLSVSKIRMDLPWVDQGASSKTPLHRGGLLQNGLESTALLSFARPPVVVAAFFLFFFVEAPSQHTAWVAIGHRRTVSPEDSLQNLLPSDRQKSSASMIGAGLMSGSDLHKKGPSHGCVLLGFMGFISLLSL